MSTTHSLAAPKHVVRTRFGSGSSGPSYRQLMQVEIRHGFYNAVGGKCHDFEICPTAATATLLRSLGLLFRSEGTAFSVLSDRNRDEQLVQYVQTCVQESGLSPRLAFLLTLRNPYFVNFTEMPVNYSPSRGCYYFSNSSAKLDPDGEMVLDPDFSADPPLLPTGSQFEVQVSAESTKCVTLQDVGGAVVYGKAVQGSHRPQEVFLSLGALPEGRYTVGECVNECDGCSGAGITPQSNVLYTRSATQPFCMIDLFLSDPGTDGGTCCVSGGQVVPAQYLLRFQPRETIWNYYVVSKGAPLQDLRIVQEPVPGAAKAPAAVNFRGPESVVLPNGQPAFRFMSESSIPLLEQSTYNFQLRGQIGFQEVRNGVLMGRLPVASNRQVIPGAPNFATGDRGPSSLSSSASALPLPAQNFSDMYVYV